MIMVESIPMRAKFEELKKVLLSIKKGSKILIIGDRDHDGIPSAVILSRIFENLGFAYEKDFFVKFKNHSDMKDFNDEKTQQELQKYNYIFFLDFSLENTSFLKNSFLVTLDHHKTNAQANLVINPSFELSNSENPSACALTYYLYFLMFGHDKNLQRLAFIGALLDWFVMGSLPYLDLTKDSEGYFVNGGLVVPGIYSLGFIFYMVDSEEFSDMWVFKRIFFECRENLLKMRFLPPNFYKRLNKNSSKNSKIIENLFSKIIIEKNIIFLNLNNITDELKKQTNQAVQVLFPEYTSIILVTNKTDNKCVVSMRSRKHNLVELINYLKANAKLIQGGGHPVAAGCSFEKSELIKIKKLILKHIDDFKNAGLK